MRKRWILIPVLALLCAWMLPLSAALGDALYFLDSGNLLSEETKREIFDGNRRLAQRCDAQIAIVLIEDIGGGNIGKYATGMGDLWGVGAHGVLLLITTADNEHYIYIGEGIRDVFPDGVPEKLAEDCLEPNLAEGRYDAAARTFFEAAFVRVAQNYAPELARLYHTEGDREIDVSESQDGKMAAAGGFLLAIVAGVGLMAAIRMIRRRKYKDI